MTKTRLSAVAILLALLIPGRAHSECTGVFASARTYSSGGASNSSVSEVLVRDVNGDGHRDVVIALQASGSGAAGGVSILFGSRTGLLQAAQVYPLDIFAASGIDVADFNSDGRMDIVAVHSGNYVSVLFQRPDGTFGTQKQIVPTSQGLFLLRAADLNGDGHADFIVTGFRPNGGSLATVISNGTGSFMSSLTGVTDRFSGLGDRLHLADFNGDQVLDLAVSVELDARVKIYLRGRDGSILESAAVSFSGSPNVDVGEFNGDGRPDLAVSIGNGSVAVLLGLPNGRLSAPAFHSVTRRLTAVESADFTGDGKQDILATSSVFGDPELWLLAGDGAGGFATPVRLGLAVSVGFSTDSGDLDGDGDRETVTGSGQSVVVINNGCGSRRRAVRR